MRVVFDSKHVLVTLTKNKSYEIISENDWAYYITNDFDKKYWYTPVQIRKRVAL